jgi:hypothetical protein
LSRVFIDRGWIINTGLSLAVILIVTFGGQITRKPVHWSTSIFLQAILLNQFLNFLNVRRNLMKLVAPVFSKGTSLGYCTCISALFSFLILIRYLSERVSVIAHRVSWFRLFDVWNIWFIEIAVLKGVAMQTLVINLLCLYQRRSLFYL